MNHLINKYITITKEQDTLLIKIRYSDFAHWPGLALLLILVGSPFILIYEIITNRINIVIVSSIVIIIVLCFFLVFFAYYMLLSSEWVFDSKLYEIKIFKRLLVFRKTQNIEYANVKYIFLQRDRIKNLFQSYEIVLFLGKKEKISMYVGELIECEKLGNIVSDFTEKELYYEPEVTKIPDWKFK